MQAGGKKKELDKREQELHAQRKDERMKRKKALEDVIIKERQMKNEARIKKQHEIKIFKGRKVMERGKKPDVKPRQTNDDMPSQAILDQLKYIGGKVYEDETAHG